MQTEKQNNFIVPSFILSVVMIISVSIFPSISFYSSVQTLMFVLLLISTITLLNTYNFKLEKLYTFSILSLIIVSLVSYFGADYQVNVRDYMYVLFSSILAGFTFMFVPTKLKKKVLLVPIFIALWLSMILFSKFIVAPYTFFIESGNAFESLGISTNIVAGFLVLAYPLTYIHIKEKFNLKVMIPITAFILFAVFLTKSRVAICLSTITSFIFLYEYRDNKYVKLVYVVLIASLIASMFYITKIKDTMVSLHERMICWQTAFAIFKDNVWFGCGFGNYASMFASYRTQNIQYCTYAHNVFIQMLSDLGVLGFISFVLFIISFYMKVLDRVLENKDIYFCSVIAVSVTSFLAANYLDCSFFSPTNMITFFVLCASCFEIKSQRVPKERINFYILFLITAIFVLYICKPIVAKVYYNKGINYYVIKQYKFATDEFSKALKLDKKNPQYLIQIAKSQFALYTNYRNEIGQIYIDNAIEYNKKAIELYKHSAQLRLSLASFYWNADMADKALETMEEAIKYDKFNKYYNDYYFQLKNS